MDFLFLVLYILADLISFLEIQRLQLAGSSSTVFAANLIVYRSPDFHRLEAILMQLYYSLKRDHTLHRYSLQEVTHEKDKYYVISQYLECLNAVERFQGEYHIVLEPSLPPVVDPTIRGTRN